MEDQLVLHQQEARTFAGYFFLTGCMTLPFFNDFPLFAGISASFRDLSTVFFMLSGMVLFLEFPLRKQNLKITYADIVFVCGLIALVWAGVLWNLTKSGIICGEAICGTSRMISSGFAISAKLILLLVFVHFIRAEGVARIGVFIRFGFYASLGYVLLELFDSYIPYYLGYASSGVLNAVEGFFHLRASDIGANRTRGLAFEPSYQAIFLIACLPFLLADTRQGKRLRNIVAWMVCMITSASLTGLAATVAFFVVYNLKRAKLLSALVGMLILMATLGAYIFFSDSNLEALDINGNSFTSTLTRTASWVATYYAVLDNLAFGVGPGMSGYWLTNYYPDFSTGVPGMQDWYDLGRGSFEAPTFASPLTFILDYGLISCLVIVAYLFYSGALQNALRSRIGRASIIAMFVASFGLSGYLIWCYGLFIAITLSRGWGQLDTLASEGRLDSLHNNKVLRLKSVVS